MLAYIIRRLIFVVPTLLGKDDLWQRMPPELQERVWGQSEQALARGHQEIGPDSA